jgi:hypothetical protein
MNPKVAAADVTNRRVQVPVWLARAGRVLSAKFAQLDLLQREKSDNPHGAG